MHAQIQFELSVKEKKMHLHLLSSESLIWVDWINCWFLTMTKKTVSIFLLSSSANHYGRQQPDLIALVNIYMKQLKDMFRLRRPDDPEYKQQ